MPVITGRCVPCASFCERRRHMHLHPPGPRATARPGGIYLSASLRDARQRATDRSTSVRSCSVESSEETASGPRSPAEVGRTCPNRTSAGCGARTSRRADSVRPTTTTTADSYSFGKSGRISRRRRSNAWVPRISSPAKLRRIRPVHGF